MVEPSSLSVPVPTPQQRRRVWLVVALVLGPILLGALLVRFSGSSPAESKAARGPEAAPVRVVPAARRTLTLRAEYRGELDAEAAELAAQVTGTLESVSVNIGDAVERGDLLARIDRSRAVRQVAEAQAQVRGAGAAIERVDSELALARVELERAERLATQGLIAERDLDTLRARVRALDAERLSARATAEQARARVGVLGQTVDETRLVAPFDGAVAERFLDPGALVQPGTRVLRLVRRGPLRVRFRVQERDLAQVAVGKQVEVVTQAAGARRFAGAVQRIAAEVNRLDRTVAVEALLDAEHEALRPGMYAVVSLELSTLTDATVVPAEAVIESTGTERRRGVFVVEGELARFRPVEVVGEAEGLAAVVGQVAPGARVITLGHHLLRDQAKVRTVGEDET